MKIGVSSYSYIQLVRSGKMDFLDIPAKAKEMGFDVLEFSKLYTPDDETSLSFAPRLKEACDKADIEVANYTIAADFLNGCDGDWKAEVERLKDEVRTAGILGSPGMRHDATKGFGPGHHPAVHFEDALPTLIDGCRAVTEFAAEKGIRTMIENHGFFCQDSDRVEALIVGVDHPNFGVLVDMGNFLCADEDPADAVERLMPYAFHVHAKDFHTKPGDVMNPGGWMVTRGGNYLRGAIVGHGDVPILQCLNIMKRADYDGILSIEFEGLEDPIKGISLGLENLRKQVNLAGF